MSKPPSDATVIRNLRRELAAERDACMRMPAEARSDEGPTPMNTPTERERFEAWWQGPIHPGVSPLDKEKFWIGWQARAADGTTG